jgi:PKD repeat protein
MSVFTFDQIAIMHGELKSTPRSSNVTAANLIATGVTKSSVAPTADFNSNTRVICAGSPVQFFDLSCKGAPTVRSWTFTGASTPSSSDINPTVIYQTPGVYSVSLLAQNSKGTNSIKKDNYITVLPKNGSLIPNYEEGFEGADPVSLGFKHLSPSPYQFAVTNKTAFTGSKCYMANIATNSTNVGNLYTFVTPNVDMTKIPGGTGGKMTFYCSYTQPNANATEILRVYASDDCGATFKKIYERSGTALSYAGASYASNWVPSSPSHWKRHGIGNLDNIGLGSKTNVIFKFEIQSAGGNPVYIDNINIGQWFAGESTLEKEGFKFQLFPNPAQDFATFTVNSLTPTQSATLALYDYAGRKIQDIFQGSLNVGIEEFKIEAPKNTQNGIYFVKLTTETGTYSRTIIFSAQ